MNYSRHEGRLFELEALELALAFEQGFFLLALEQYLFEARTTQFFVAEERYVDLFSLRSASLLRASPSIRERYFHRGNHKIFVPLPAVFRLEELFLLLNLETETGLGE